MIRLLPILLLLSLTTSAYHQPWVTTQYPQDKDKLWWDENWWQDGILPVPNNYAVVSEQITYQSGDNEINAFVFRPKNKGKYLPVLFQHGRRGLDELVKPMAKRLAARGLIVLAPDLYNSHFLAALPIKHNYKLELDTAAAIDVLLARDDIIGNKICTVSHTRGGYYTLKALTTHKQQDKVGCYVASYPHWQDPNAAEPLQVYQYAPEIDDLKVPVLVFFGEHEQYQRTRSIISAVKSLNDLGRMPQLIIYPGVGRGFDFRAPSVRTFADDLATKDAIQRTVDFINKNLQH